MARKKATYSDPTSSEDLRKRNAEAYRNLLAENKQLAARVETLEMELREKVREWEMAESEVTELREYKYREREREQRYTLQIDQANRNNAELSGRLEWLTRGNTEMERNYDTVAQMADAAELLCRQISSVSRSMPHDHSAEAIRRVFGYGGFVNRSDDEEMPF